MCDIQLIAYIIALHYSVLPSYQYVVQYVPGGFRVDSYGRRRLSRLGQLPGVLLAPDCGIRS